MTIVNLYRYETEKGIVITPNKREETDEPHMFRVIADEYKLLTDGTNTMACIDTHTPDIYSEVDDPEYEETEEKNEVVE